LAEPTIKQIDPRGRTIYWIGPPGQAEDAGPETDFYAVETKHASITPLKIDFTNYTVFKHLSNWVDQSLLSV
jgi:5'-nucleotidase